MKGKPILTALALGALFFPGAARASGPGAEANPYGVIFQHSVFGLVPLPPPANVNAAIPPPDILVNGIMSIFGRKYALFKLPANKGKSYLLGEGQSDGEIELLSVDERGGKIKINNHGVVQAIALSKPPASSSQPAAVTAPNAAPVVLAGNILRQSAGQGIAPEALENKPMPIAMPVVSAGFYAGVAGGSSGNSQGGSSSGSGTSSSSGSGSQSSGGLSSTPRPEPDPWWVVGSKNLEAARISTADLVSSGQTEPWPLTPFTPPGTPAKLIGPERLYFGHGVYQGVDSGENPGLN